MELFHVDYGALLNFLTSAAYSTPTRPGLKVSAAIKIAVHFCKMSGTIYHDDDSMENALDRVCKGLNSAVGRNLLQK